MTTKNMQVLLARRPEGEPQTDDFRIVESDLLKPDDGQFQALCPGYRTGATE